MRRTVFIVLLFLSAVSTYSQNKLSGYLSLQYNRTLYDITFGNNPSGAGLGFETVLNGKARVRPGIEVTADVYLEDDKVFRVAPNGTEIKDVNSMVNLFAGGLVNVENGFFSVYAGTSFINESVLFGIKPSFGFYTRSKKIKGKVSYINIFNRDKLIKKDFGTISFAIAFKLF